MLVIPFSHDQPDHAYRLKKRGVARTLARSKYTAANAVREIEILLRVPGYAERAREMGAKVRSETGTATACDLLEGLLAERPSAIAVSSASAIHGS